MSLLPVSTTTISKLVETFPFSSIYFSSVLFSLLYCHQINLYENTNFKVIIMIKKKDPNSLASYSRSSIIWFLFFFFNLIFHYFPTQILYFSQVYLFLLIYITFILKKKKSIKNFRHSKRLKKNKIK